ncbi:odorant receptor Or2-like [Tenebrio molitor]|uniref:odorant receptor Or2-like n=1 Tax=Tenebrio molitor TaxID=7067 RepID=UPI003624A2DA
MRIDQLKSMISRCFRGDVATGRTRLNECIQYHIDIISYADRFNSCFTNGMFIHLATTGIICGCLENQIAKEQHLGAILHILGWITSLFVSCLGGQILMDSSSSIADAAYNSNWYNANVQMRRDLIVMIVRSQKPLFVATGAFNVLCFSLFVTIMKMSYSILTLLK